MARQGTTACAASNLYLSIDDAYVIEVAQRFVDDGTLDEVIVIRSDGSLVHLR